MKGDNIMATHILPTQPSISHDPLGDMEGPELQLPKNQETELTELLSSHIQSQPVTPQKKRAYFWIKAKTGDEAFFGATEERDRKLNIKILKKCGYDVQVFRSNREFFDHIKQDPSKIDLLMISGHGLPHYLEDVRVKEGKVVSRNETLTSDERENGFSQVTSLLGEKSIVALDACLTGNKSADENLAKVISKTAPQAKVFASQYETRCEPGFMFDEDETGKPVVSSIMYQAAERNLIPSMPVVYQDGEELTKQEAVPFQYPQRQTQRMNPYVKGGVILGTLMTVIAVGAWLFSRYQGQATI